MFDYQETVTMKFLLRICAMYLENLVVYYRTEEEQ